MNQRQDREWQKVLNKIKKVAFSVSDYIQEIIPTASNLTRVTLSKKKDIYSSSNRLKEASRD